MKFTYLQIKGTIGETKVDLNIGVDLTGLFKALPEIIKQATKIAADAK